MNATPQRKLLLVLIDGVGDVTLRCGGCGTTSTTSTSMRTSMRTSTSTSTSTTATPLSVSSTPVLDAIARAGANGLIDPVEPGLACGSDTAHLSLFGYDPRVVYRGRGAFESLGAGMDMRAVGFSLCCDSALIRLTLRYSECAAGCRGISRLRVTSR